MKNCKSLLLVPALEERFFKKLSVIPADSVIFDLEDGIALNHKIEARKKLGEYLKKYPVKGKEVIIRINSLRSKYGKDDIKTILNYQPDCIMYPKTESCTEILELDSIITEFEDKKKKNLNKSIEIIPTIETTTGILNVKDILKNSKRITGIIFGTEDLTSEMLIERKKIYENPLLTFALCYLSIIACSNKIDLIDGVYPFVDDDSLNSLKKEAVFTHNIGAKGKIAIHPKQIPIINETFSLTENSINFISSEVDIIINNVKKKGLTAGVVDKKRFIGFPEIKRASKIIKILDKEGSRSNKKIENLINKVSWLTRD
ncbi:MAG: CoA ester lyase [Nanoarchaeota archaeon]|nr:CoA ester lyase [Nanoarchaeota archaeon]